MRAVFQSNVLYGKKYVACGDSFTEGDFTGLADAAGNTGIANTDVYDSEWGCYKTEEDYQAPLMHRVRGRDEVCERAKALRMSQFRVSSTNTHPNLQAHIYESTFIENFLRSL